MIKVHIVSRLAYLVDKLSLIQIPVIPDTVVSCFIFQEQYSELRISMNQRPGYSHNFGFTTNWTSSGALVQTVEEGKCLFNCTNFILVFSLQRLLNYVLTACYRYFKNLRQTLEKLIFCLLIYFGQPSCLEVDLSQNIKRHFPNQECFYDMEKV